MTEDFALVWKRICDNQRNKFLTIRKESFEYKIEDECFIPLSIKDEISVFKIPLSDRKEKFLPVY